MKSEFAFHGKMRQLIIKQKKELLDPTRVKIENIKRIFNSENKLLEDNYNKEISIFEKTKEKVISDLGKKKEFETKSLIDRRKSTASYKEGRKGSIVGLFVGIGVGMVLYIITAIVIEIIAIAAKDIKKSEDAITILVFLGSIAVSMYVYSKKYKESFRYDDSKHAWYVDDTYTNNTALIEIEIDEANKRNEDDMLCLRKKYDEDASNIRRKFDQGLFELTRTIEAQVASFHKLFADFYLEIGVVGKGWDDQAWKQWELDVSPEFASWIGKFMVITNDLKEYLPNLDWDFQIPAFIPFSYDKGFLIEAIGPQKELAIKAIQSVCLRALAMTPPGKMLFTFIDPVGVGNSVSSFMALAGYDKSMMSGKAWSNSRDIENQLERLVEHIEDVIRVRLKDDYPDISAYNKNAGAIAEAFRLLVIFDFPANFTDTSFKCLTSIMRNGPRCGVYTLIVRDSSVKLPYGIDEEQLNESTARIVGTADCSFQNELMKPWERSKDHFFWADPDFNQCILVLDAPPEKELFQKIISTSGSSAVIAMNIEVPFDELFEKYGPPPEKWWTGAADQNLAIPLGPRTGVEPQRLILNEGLMTHCLIVGKIGSGKTNLMHVIILGLALTYPPEELEILLVDFKGGVGFKPYADHHLPHASVIAVDSEREFGISVLRGMDNKFTERTKEFRKHTVDNLSAYRAKKTGTKMPRILLIVDEFQEFFREDDDIGREAKTILDKLIRMGRGPGIHVMLATQTLAGSLSLPSSTINQMSVRIALQCSDADSRLILADDNPAARALTRAGEAIFNADNGKSEGNYKFQVALLDDAALEAGLSKIDALVEKCGPKPKPIVFEGNSPAQIEDNEALLELFGRDGETVPTSSPVAWVGDPIAMAAATQFKLSRKSGKHILIVDRAEQEGMGILLSAWISLISQSDPKARFLVLDNSRADSPWEKMAVRFRELFPGRIEMVERKRLSETLKSIHELVAQRLESPAGQTSPVVYWLLLGVQRARDIRENEYETMSMLGDILRDGPEVGVHILAQCDSYNNAQRAFGSNLREFGIRIAGPMSSEDSHALIDDGAAAKLVKENRAYLYDEDEPGKLQLFRPYDLPDEGYLLRISSLFQRKE